MAHLNEAAAQTPTTTTVSSSGSPSYGGLPVTFTATVSGIGGTPTGTVTFYWNCPHTCGTGFQQIGTATLSGGTATVTQTPSTYGGLQSNYTIRAIYNGDGIHQASTSSDFTQSVQRASTTTIVSSSLNPSTLGEAVTLTATVTSDVGSSVTGQIRFYDGDTLLGTFELDPSGQASLATTSLAAGSHNITTVFAGGFEHLGSTSPALVQSVTLGAGTPTTTTVSSSGSPSYGGLPVTFTATVSGTSGTPTGTVTFYRSCPYTCGTGFQQFGTATLSGGTATITQTLTTYGGGQSAYVIHAIYNGDSSNQASTSADFTQNVQRASTTLTVSSSSNPSSLGESVTLTATVNSIGGAATFSNLYSNDIAFHDDGALLGYANINSSGVATLTTAFFTEGSRNITAVFRGAGEHLGSTSPALVQSVTLGAGTPTTTTVSSSGSPSYGGLPVTFTAMVSGTSGTPTGTVTFYWSCSYTCGTGFQQFGTATLSGGTATIAQALSTYGDGQSAYMIRAIYNGDGSNQASTSADFTQNVQRPGASTTVSSSLNPSALGEAVTLTATVTSDVGSTVAGEVRFFDGDSLLGNSLLNASGQASITTSSLAAGSHSVTVRFLSWSDHTNSTSQPLLQAVNQGMTVSTTVLTSSTNPSEYNQSITLTATVTGADGPPSGTVTFADGANILANVTLAGGVATFSTSALSIGARNLTASYNGSTVYAVSTGILTQTVSPPTITVTTSVLPSATFGSSFIVPALTASGGTSPYTFAATGLPSGLTLNLGTGVISGTPTQSGTFTVAVTATDSTPVHQGGPFTSASKNLSLEVGPATVAITTSSLPAGNIGTAYTSPALTVSGGTAPYTFAESGLPPGLSLNNSSGAISGTPTQAGTFTVDVTATDSTTGANGGPFTSTTKSLSLVINPAAASVVLTSTPNPAFEGQPVVLTATVSPSVATGTVTFRDGPDVLGATSLSGGTATLSTASLMAGAHTLTATYNGDASYAASTSAPVGQTVTPNGTVVLAVATSEGDGAFTFSSPTSPLNVAVTSSGGSGQSASISLNPGTYSVTVTPPSGFGLTSVTCSDGDSNGNVAGRSADILLASAETVICTFSTVNSAKKTVEVISRFMGRRADLLLSNGPDSNRQINRLVEAGGGVNGSSSASANLQAEPSTRVNNLSDQSAIAQSPRGGGLAASSGRLRSFAERLAEVSSSKDEPHNAQPLSPMKMTGSNNGPMQFSFATSLAQITKFSADQAAQKAQLDGSVMGLGALTLPTSRRNFSPFDLWLEGKYFRFADDRDDTDSDGHFAVVYLGADYVVSPSFLIGALVQYDSMEQDSTREAYRIKGRGWMAGPYATLRLSDNVFLQARAAWGKSENDVSPFLTYTDAFDSTRWLVSSTLTGTWQNGPWEIRPSATLAYIEDRSQSYVDSLGVSIPGVTVSLGQLKAGPRFSYGFEPTPGTLLDVHLGVEALWNFTSSDQVADFGGTLSGPEEVRGRVELGLTATFANGIGLDVAGSYDGIGSKDFESIGGRATLRIPLQ
ncbi:Ig-like domain repeat protein [Leptospira interrogans]